MEKAARTKRKRTQVSYYEPDPDDVPLDDEAEDVPGPVPAVDRFQEDKAGEQDQDGDQVDEHGDDDFSPNKKHKSKAKTKSKTPVRAKCAKKKDKKPFRIMHLPPELRNLIYHHVLVETVQELSLVSTDGHRTAVRGKMIKSTFDYASSFATDSWRTLKQRRKDSGHTRLHPKLLTVSRQINKEAGAVLYGQRICFEHPVALFNFLASIGPANRLLLQDLVVYGWNNDKPQWQALRYPALSFLGSATNIKSLLFDRRVYSREDHMDSRFLAYYDSAASEFWKDARIFYRETDAVRGKGTAASVVKFGQLNFGTPEQIEDNPKRVEDCEDSFMDRLEQLHTANADVWT